MAYSFQRASRAMAITSSTTAVAFLANSLSDLMPIRGFGIYAAIIIPVNFLLVIVALPPLTIIYETKIRPCCRRREQSLDKAKTTRNICCRQQKAQSEPLEGDVLSRFFAGPFFNFLVKMRWPIVVLFSCTGVSTLYFATGIQPLSESEEFLPADSFILKTRRILEDNFSSSGVDSSSFSVSICWGALGLEKSDVGLWDASNIGSIQWDDTFTVSTRRN